MSTKNNLVYVFLVVLFYFIMANAVSAHCDSMEGPVVKASKKALETGNLNYVFIWVREDNEEEIKTMFDKVIKVRNLSPDAKELAEMYFFETVVRLHRAGEGEGYTGVKPVGYKPEEGIEAADIAIDKGSANNVLNNLNKKYHSKVKQLFSDLQLKKNYDVNDVKAGRKYVESYVLFIHYIEELFSGKNHNDTKHIHKK